MSASSYSVPVGLFGYARYTMAGRCSAIAASIASTSSVRSAFSGTPTKSSCANRADSSYITKPGTGASTFAPGFAHASEIMLMISSEPLPSSTSHVPGTPIAWRSLSSSAAGRGAG
ncbi:hypothetical protein FEP92_05558 [Burkholderia multivorans]|nr:hypothetical protein [Burkholderia multivorans]